MREPELIEVADRYASVRRCVEHASTLTTARVPVMKPVLLMYHEPSGWM